MMEYADALGAVLAAARPLPIESVALARADGRFLAREVTARWDMPRQDQSAMDGFAVRLEDVAGATARTPARLIPDGELRIGQSRRRQLRPGRAIKVFTGSGLPAGTEAVVMKEYVRRRGERLLVEHAAVAGEHVRRRGAEYGRGDPVLPAGTRLTPPVIGILSSFGRDAVPVRERPAITLITLGDELVPLGESLPAGKIYNSNSVAIAAALREAGIHEIHAATLPDDKRALRRAVSRGLQRSHVVITAGGASVGEYDFVRGVNAELNVRRVFEKVAIKPGKPNYFGTWRPPGSRRLADRRLVFGLPGNPVSALVSFHQLIRPALLQMMGAAAPDGRRQAATLTAECRKKPERLEWLRGVLRPGDDGWSVTPLSRQDSHMLGGLAGANCLIHFPRRTARLERGQSVEVLPLAWCR